MKFKLLSTLAGVFASAVLSVATPAHAADDSLSAILAKKSIALGVASDLISSSLAWISPRLN